MIRPTRKTQLDPKRKLKRQTSASPRATDGGFLTTLETTARAMVAFVKRFLFTCSQVAFHPRKLGHLLAARNEAASVVGPFTFLVITGFYAVKLLRFAIIFFFLLPISYLKSCESETTENVRWPEFSQLLIPPSITQLLTVGVPIIAACLALAWMVQKALVKSAPRNRQFYAQGASYAFGLGFILLLPLCLLAAVWSFSVSDDSLKWLHEYVFVGDADANIAGFLLLVSGAVFWVAASLYSVVVSAFAATPDLQLSRRKRLSVLCTSLVASISMFSVVFLLAYPTASQEFESSYRPKTFLYLQAIRPLAIRADAELTLAVTNNTKMQLQFKVEDVYIFDREGDEYFSRIERMPGEAIESPLFRLEPLERSWMVIRIGSPKTAQDPKRDANIRPVKLCLSTPIGNAICAFVRKTRAEENSGDN